MDLSPVIKAFSDRFPIDKMLSKEAVCGIWNTSESALVSYVVARSGFDTVIVCGSSDEAERICEDSRMFLGGGHNIDLLDNEAPELRLPVIGRIASGSKNVAVAGSLDSFLKKTYKKDGIKDKVLNIKKGQRADIGALSSSLFKLGYSRVYMVEEEGEFSVRGGIVDIFSPGDRPKRVEVSFDAVESIREFDLVSQRSTGVFEGTAILPFYEENAGSIFDLFKKPPLVLLSLPQGVDIPSNIPRGSKTILLSRFPLKDKESVDVGCELPGSFGGDIDKMISSLDKVNGDIFVISKQAMRLREIFADVPRNINIVHGELPEGFYMPGGNIRLYTDLEIFGEHIPRRRFKALKETSPVKKFDLGFKEGDFVVHKDYGVGVYKGVERQSIDGVQSDFLFIQYAGEDCLYVPISKMHLISKYSAPAESPPKLNRLGTSEWVHTKKKAKNSLKDLTKELLQLYSSRNKSQATAFASDSQWQKEFESAFPYEETPDQIEAVAMVKKDMESEKPMDRLLCGDVGFGKTEVALRAAFKAVDNGKQVCMLVPTTILAEQHYLLFKERFSPFPFVVEMLSRFKSQAEQKDIIKKIESGTVDIVIGTHRLFNKDIKFKDLGLLIIDEEQRFGVSHKESIKKFRNNVDVLAMSATPIPRTMYMALSGIWDMSVIETPPPGRSSIKTFVMPWEKAVIRQAIEKEMERGGQVFYVHNRVDSISSTVNKLKHICPFARIAFAHGQMNERSLEEIMTDFIDRKFDVLVTTTIIESGLDMPNVNTIIIENPQRMGLSTLYQLRGRVGRSAVKANAYLLYEEGRLFTDKSLERLTAIKSFTDLGSGQKIAMKDLEIRGAGNVLGAQQHGHMISIGFDLYCELLKEVSASAKGEPLLRRTAPVVEIKMDAFIPEDYITEEIERIAVYKRMNAVASAEEAKELMSELNDRFGSVPQQVKNLFLIVEVRTMASVKKVKSILQKGDIVLIERPSGKERLSVKGLSPKEIIAKVKSFLSCIQA